MEEAEIRDTLIKMIKDYLPDLADKPLTMDTVINTETGMDSMGLVLIISKLEARYNIKISERQMNKFVTIGDVVHYVEAKAK
jgi:acyl carrier protein